MKKTAAYLMITVMCVACSRPVAEFNYPTTVTAGKAVQFENTSSSSIAYKWYLDEDFFSDAFEPEFLFEESGRYDIELQASDGKKSDSYKSQIIVHSPNVCHVIVKTSLGDMIFALSEKTPRHLNNFIQLIESDFYSGIKFHRVMRGFMIQAGDESQKKLPRFSEIENEINESLPHFRGALAAARMPDNINPQKKSSGSQFYIVHGKPIDEDGLLNYSSENLWDYTEEQKNKYLEIGGAPQLDGNYTVFGYMVAGWDVLDAIAESYTDERDVPLEDIIILEVKEIN